MRDLERTLQPYLLKDLKKKIVLVAGPRQCGKTTLSKALSLEFDYFNYDNIDDRSALLTKKWDRKKKLIIFDELHKMPKWKSWLKGVYDTEGNSPAILVTGSARLDTFRKAGDSLAGRHFYYHLHPFDLKELSNAKTKMSHSEIFERLLKVGGYPEPFLNGEMSDYRRWRQTHLDIIVKQDLLDLEQTRDIRNIELLIQILRERVGSGVSINSLATDLQKDHKTVQKWLTLLEDLFVIFRVTPFSKNIERSLKKEPKFYFYDIGLVEGSNAQKMENLVACALLKESHFLLDAKGRAFHLHSLKVKGGKEIDFVMVPENKEESALLIEVKWSDSEASPNFKLFKNAFKKLRMIQLVQELKRDHTTSLGVEVRQASNWLSDFQL